MFYGNLQVFQFDYVNIMFAIKKNSFKYRYLIFAQNNCNITNVSKNDYNIF